MVTVDMRTLRCQVTHAPHRCRRADFHRLPPLLPRTCLYTLVITRVLRSLYAVLVYLPRILLRVCYNTVCASCVVDCNAPHTVAVTYHATARAPRFVVSLVCHSPRGSRCHLRSGFCCTFWVTRGCAGLRALLPLGSCAIFSAARLPVRLPGTACNTAPHVLCHRSRTWFCSYTYTAFGFCCTFTFWFLSPPLDGSRFCHLPVLPVRVRLWTTTHCLRFCSLYAVAAVRFTTAGCHLPPAWITFAYLRFHGCVRSNTCSVYAYLQFLQFTSRTYRTPAAADHHAVSTRLLVHRWFACLSRFLRGYWHATPFSFCRFLLPTRLHFFGLRLVCWVYRFGHAFAFWRLQSQFQAAYAGLSTRSILRSPL